jgi:Beta-propeller repeat
MQVDAAGNLAVNVAGHGRVRAGNPRTLLELAPVAWQARDGQRTAVSVRYAIAPNGDVGFALGSYDTTQALIIDPTLIFSTYLGGAANDSGQAIAVDTSGNTYITGATL